MSAALPWILVGLAIAVTAAGYAKEQKTKRKAQKRLQSIFMAAGLILGSAINGMNLIPCDHSVVICIGALWGLAIGTFVDTDWFWKREQRCTRDF